MRNAYDERHAEFDEHSGTKMYESDKGPIAQEAIRFWELQEAVLDILFEHQADEPRGYHENWYDYVHYVQEFANYNPKYQQKLEEKYSDWKFPPKLLTKNAEDFIALSKSGKTDKPSYHWILRFFRLMDTFYSFEIAQTHAQYRYSNNLESKELADTMIRKVLKFVSDEKRAYEDSYVDVMGKINADNADGLKAHVELANRIFDRNTQALLLNDSEVNK